MRSSLSHTCKAAAILLLLAYPAALAAQSADPREQGRELMERVVQGLGGKELVKSIRTARRQYRQERQWATGTRQVFSIDYVWSKAGDYRQAFSFSQDGSAPHPYVCLGHGSVTKYFDATTRKDVGEGCTGDRNHIGEAPWFIALHHDDDAFLFVAGGTKMFNGQQVSALRVSGIHDPAFSEPIDFFVNGSTGEIYGLEATIKSDGSRWQMTFRDWRSVKGLRVPFEEDAVVTKPNGEPGYRQSMALSGFDWNVEIPPGTFEEFRAAMPAMATVEAPPTYFPPIDVPGTLHIASQPGAAVYLDATPHGTIPASGQLEVPEVKSGAHSLKLTLEGYQDWTQPVTVKSGESLPVAALLVKAGPRSLTENEVSDLLNGGVSPRRAEQIVQERGVNFAVDRDAEKRLRAAGADDHLLLVIAQSKK